MPRKPTGFCRTIGSSRFCTKTESTSRAERWRNTVKRCAFHLRCCGDATSRWECRAPEIPAPAETRPKRGAHGHPGAFAVGVPLARTHPRPDVKTGRGVHHG